MPSFTPTMEITLEEGVARYEVHPAVQSYLSQKGFAFHAPPMVQTPTGPQPYRGEIPDQLTEVTDKELGDYLSMTSAWKQYVAEQLAEAFAFRESAKSQLGLIDAKLRMLYKHDEEDKKRNVQERQDLMTLDQRHVQVASRLLFYETMYHYLKAIYDSADQSYSAVSRRITQRGQDLDGTLRGQNVGAMLNSPVFRRGGT